MSKYKQVFDARKQETGKNEKITEPKSNNPEVKKSVKTEIVKNGNPEKVKSQNMEIQKTGNKEDLSKLVNLGIKVAEGRRRYWGGKAKMEGVTISEIIIEALSKRFGEPD